jgi:site-specific recombinase XerD
MAHRKTSKRSKAKTMLRLADLEQSKNAVLHSLGATSSQESYGHAIDEFIGWYCSEPRLSFNRTVVLRYRFFLEQKNLAPSTINVRLAAVRRLANEASDTGLLSPDLAAGIRRVKGAKRLGVRIGNWLTIDQSRSLLGKPSDSLRGKRDRAILALLIGCGLRRAELVGLRTGDFQVREDHCVIADLVGKGKHIRTVPVPLWAKRRVDEWTVASAITEGAIFRRVSRLDKIWGDGITPKAIWHVVRAAAKRADIKNLAPHDLRRTCARLCHLAGGELEQIQFLLGHASVQTTERYLGCKQNLGHPVNDLFDLRMDQQVPEEDCESVSPNGVIEAVEKTFEPGIECRHGGLKHDQPVFEAQSVPERTHMVEVGKGHRSQSFRRCSEAGTARDHAGSKTEGKGDERTSGRVGVGTVLDPAS